MPPFEAFRDAESYYATLAHELTHWTKHAQRLNRDFGRKSWGDEGYSREELVAELGSAFLCADLELHQEPREENAAYIATWLEVLKNDNRAIFAAAAHAQRAADYLNQNRRRAGPRDLRGLMHIIYDVLLVDAFLSALKSRKQINAEAPRSKSQDLPRTKSPSVDQYP